VNQLNPCVPDDRSELLRALAEQYARQHTSLESWVLVYFAPFRLLRRFGVDPRTSQGYLATGLFATVLCLSPALVITAITGQWALAPVKAWAVVAVGFGVLLAIAYPVYRTIIDALVSFHRSMADEAGLRRLIAWDRRWYSLRASAPAAGAFTLGMLIVLFFIQRRTSGVSIPAGTIAVGAMLIYQVGEITYGTFMLAIETRILVAYDYILYRLSPIDSVALRRSIPGYNQVGLGNSLIVTLIIIGFVILLPARSSLIGPIALIMLLMSYLGIAFGMFMPRLAMQRIIRAEKEREMAPLQRRLNELSARLRELSEEEYQELKRLAEIHDTIRDSSENLLPLATIGQIIGTLILPTVTFIIAVAGEAYVSPLMDRLIR
jgi:signal transduction histidine kinase